MKQQKKFSAQFEEYMAYRKWRALKLREISAESAAEKAADKLRVIRQELETARCEHVYALCRVLRENRSAK